MAPHSSILAWKISWTEEPLGCSPWGREELDMTERLHFHFSLSCIGEGNGNPLQCSCLENPRDRGAWKAAASGVAQSQHDWVTHIANQQCFDSFRWTVKGLSHTYMCILSPPNSPPIQAATWHWAEFPVLSRRSLLVIHFKYSSVYMLIPNSPKIPSPYPFPRQPESNLLFL